MKKAAIYVRVSKEREEMHSPKIQLEKCLSYCREKKWQVIPQNSQTIPFEDIDFSGRNTNRPAYQELLAHLKDIDVVVVHSLSRFGRSRKEFWSGLEELKNNDVDFVAINQQFDTTTAGGRLVLGILIELAQFESDQISERWRDILAYLASQGKYHGGPPPFGYDYDPKTKTLTLNEGEAETVRWIYETYLTTSSLRRVTELLNEKGITPKKNNGAWATRTVGKILTNPIYAGKIPHKDKTHQGIHDPIISQDLFEKVQSLKKINKGAARKISKPAHIFSGLLRCAHCGSAMRYRAYTKNDPHPQYSCSGRTNKGKITCPGAYIHYKTVENYALPKFWDRINEKYLASKVKVKMKEQDLKRGDKNELLKKRLEKIEGSQDRLLKAYIDDQVIGKDEFARKNKQLREQREEILVRIQDLEMAKLEDQFAGEKLKTLKSLKEQDIGQVWQSLPLVEKRDILALFIQKITIRRGKEHKVRIYWRF